MHFCLGESHTQLNPIMNRLWWDLVVFLRWPDTWLVGPESIPLKEEMYSFPTATVTQNHHLVASNNTNSFCDSSVGQKSKMALPELRPSMGLLSGGEGRTRFLASSPSRCCPCPEALGCFHRLQSQKDYFLPHPLPGPLIRTHIFLFLSPLIPEFGKCWDYAILFQNYSTICMAAFQLQGYKWRYSDMD